MPDAPRADGRTLYYELHGEGDGTPIVFLGGMTQTTRNWRSQGRAFASLAPVIAYDARGQGQSPVEGPELTLELHVEDLAGLLDHLGQDRVHLVGFSHGARVALGFATTHPERVARMVLTSATAEPTALATAIVQAWRGVLALGGLEAMSWAALPTILGEAFLQENQAILPGVVKAGTSRNSEEGIRRMLDAMIAFPPLDALAGRVTCPTRVIYASHDLLVAPAGARRLAELCGGDAVEITDAGHTLPIERPQAWRDAVLSFLELS